MCIAGNWYNFTIYILINQGNLLTISPSPFKTEVQGTILFLKGLKESGRIEEHGPKYKFNPGDWPVCGSKGSNADNNSEKNLGLFSCLIILREESQKEALEFNS